MVSKAYAVVYEDEIKTDSYFPITFHLQHRKVSVPHQEELINTIAHKIKHDSNLALEIYDMHAGSLFSSKEMILPRDEVIVDIEYLENICFYNGFSLDQLNNVQKRDPDVPMNPELDFEVADYGSGLFPNLNYFNHSCIQNASRFSLGDLMFLYANSYIPKGQEICISYTMPMQQAHERRHCIQSHGFKCQCKLCLVDASEDSLYFNARQQLFTLFSRDVSPRIFKGDLSVVPLACEIIQKMETTFIQSGRQLYKFDLFHPLIALGSCYEKSRQDALAAQTYEKALAICGIDGPEIPLDPNKEVHLVDSVVQCALHVAIDLMVCHPVRSRQWTRFAIYVGKILYGLDEELFRIVYDDFMRDL